MTNKNMLIKRKSILIFITLYLSLFLVISIVPHLAEYEFRGKLSNGIYESHLTFPTDGEYGHYKKVVMFDKDSPGRIDLEYTFSTNTLYIDKAENIKELTIDCRLMYENKCQEVFEKDPKNLDADYYKTYFKETNNGLFIVTVNTDTPMEELRFVDTPLPVSVLVDNKEWWQTETEYYSATGNDVTITHIPEGATTVKIYFGEPPSKWPVAILYADKYIVLKDEEITFYGSDSYDLDGDILHHNWDFGDSYEISGNIVKHSYSELGNYTVTLTVRDNDYLEDSTNDTIYVVPSTLDTDGDNVPDALDPFPERNLDSDEDGLSNDYEDIISGTSKGKKDTDGDGIDDKAELDNGSDPNNPNDPKPRPPEKEEKKSESPIIWIAVGIIIVIVIILILFLMLTKRQKGKGKPDKIETRKPIVKMPPKPR